MSMILEEAARPGHATFAGGVASLADIARASRDSLRYIDNANAAHSALERAIEDRIRAVHAATGQKLENPLQRADSEWRRNQLTPSNFPLIVSPDGTRRQLNDLTTLRERYMSEFEAKLFELDGSYREIPAARQAIGAGRPLTDDAARLAREADEELATVLASRPGLGKWAAMLAGGFAGALEDPVTQLSLVVGGGPAAARTAVGRVLSIAGKEALINAATEAAIQPNVQAWRERAGLDHGLDQALNNVLFAGAMGGVFGGGLGAAGEALRRVMRPQDVERAADILRERDSQLSDPARAILADDGMRAADSLAEIREALPPPARGALDEAETIRLADDQRPAAAAPAHHDTTVARADQAIRLPDAETWPGFSPDPDQVNRVVRAIAGEPAARAAEAEPQQGLIGFLIDRGGVRDFQGELAAIGAGEVSQRFRGRLVKQSGAPLDSAREAAAEAGFFDHRYGTPDEAVARSTVADLLDELETEIRSGPRERATSAEEEALAGLAGRVDAIARMAGPAVDDGILERAARLSIDEDLEPGDALERVLVRAELSGEPAPARAARTGEPLPGWSDEELLAASENRGMVPDAQEGGLDAPGQLDPEAITLDELAALGEDALIPGEDGLVSASRLIEDIERQDNLLRVTQACRA